MHAMLEFTEVVFHPTGSDARGSDFDILNREIARVLPKGQAFDLVDEVELVIDEGKLDQDFVVAVVNGHIAVAVIRPVGRRQACMAAIASGKMVVFGGAMRMDWIERERWVADHATTIAAAFGETLVSLDGPPNKPTG